MPEVLSAKKSVSLSEVEMTDIRQSEINVMQDKFFNLRSEILNRIDNLTLVQLEKVADKVRETVDSFSMNQ